MPISRPKGMTAFVLIWVGQVVSILGSAMTGFGLLIWIWEKTQQATTMALLGFFQFVPLILMTPIAGALVDRWDRKRAMILSDLSAGIGTMAVLLLLSSNALEVWHLYGIGIFTGIFGAFQWPAYSASVTMMVEKKHFARASAMLGVAGAISGILGPPMAAAILGFFGLIPILMIDLVTMSVAILMLLVIVIPSPERKEVGKGIMSVFKDSVFGFRFIYERRLLLGLQLTFFSFNLCASFGMPLFAPMMLARTGNDRLMLGAVQSVGSIGGLVGGVVLAIWGGPKKKINGLLGGMILIGAISAIAFVPMNPYVWMVGTFSFLFLLPTVNGCSQAIWQSKVSPHLQGRVFGARALIAQVSQLFGLLAVGPLADQVFEPAMRQGGALAGMFGWITGTGPGSGMAVIITIMGVLLVIVATISFSTRVRKVEEIVPDFDAEKKDEKAEKGSKDVAAEHEQEKKV